MKLTAKPKVQDLGAFAFYQGAHDISIEETLREIATAHDIERAKVHQQSLCREKPLEATVDQLEHRRPEIDAAWSNMARRFGLHTPPIAAAITVGVLGVAGLVVDAILLGPGLDAVGISDVTLQFVAAFGLAALSATLFHLALETFSHHEHSLNITISRRSLAGLAVVALLAWGVLRGYQVKFAADLNQYPLGAFLGDHPVLASIFFCFVTLAAPLVGAAAFHDAHPRLHNWFTWKRAKRTFEQLHRELKIAEKGLDQERQTLERRLSELDAQRENWEAIAIQFHDRGRLHGARQHPHWLVLLKATNWSLAGLAVGCIAGRFLAPLYFVLPFATWISAFLFYRRVRINPTLDEYLAQQDTQFAIQTDQPLIAGRPGPKVLPPGRRNHESPHQ